MDTEKRRVIVQEIEHWRRNRLLPEQYCDFLQNLYRTPEAEGAKPILGIPSDRIVNARPRTWLLMIAIVGIICYIGFYFTSFPEPLQIAVSAVLVLAFYLAGTRFRHRRPQLSFALLAAGALTAPGAAFYFLSGTEPRQFVYGLFFLMVALFWMATGIASRFSAFHFSGWGVLALLYGWLLHHSGSAAGMARLQLSWLPLGLVIGWTGLMLLNRSRQNGQVLLATGASLWLAPEIYGLLATELAPTGLQGLLAAKIAVAGLALYASRKKWIEWIG